MAETMAGPGVALLFADADLGAHLREALVALGARIVYEGAAAQAQPEALEKSGADVVVVNLEPAEDEHFDRLHALLEQGNRRVVFNDAEASRGLSGWDKARWARHLAVKLVGSGDVDPPRPSDARQVETTHASHGTPPPETPAADVAASQPKGEPAPADPHAIEQENAESELLSAELEALLTDEDDAPEAPAAADVQVEQRQTLSVPGPATEWSLEDVDVESPATAEPAADAGHEDARQFGIEKMQAADFLKPEGEGGGDESPIEPGLKLELVSIEEAVSPTMVEKTVSEMVLDGGSSGIRRIVLVGAGPDATLELGEFLAGLPDTLPALVLIAQHQKDQHVDAVADALDTSTRLPVRVAGDGTAMRHCEAWLLPPGNRCQLGRDGRLALAPADASAAGDPSIDQSLDAMSDVFGADLVAIVLAGNGHDGLAGARAVTARGGKVWILDPASGGSDAGMATRIHEEGLATFSGSPTDLARRLVEEYA